jgi:hypothetical protein
MADNIPITVGDGGKVIAGDDVGGVIYQTVKLAAGADGVAALVSSANPLPVAEPDSLAVSGSRTSLGDLFSVDMLGYESVSVQVTSAGSATITYETSDDNINWVTTVGLISNSTETTGLLTTSTSTGLRCFARRGRYFRARVSSYTSGTVTAVGHLHKQPMTDAFRGYIYNAYQASVTAYSGGSGHDSAISQNPYRIGARAVTANYTAVQTGDTADLTCTLVGAQVIKPFSIPEHDWNYAAPSGGIVSTGGVTFKAAAGAGLRNYITALQITHMDIGAPGGAELEIRDGVSGTVIWRTTMYSSSGNMREKEPVFPTPLKSTANTALEVCVPAWSSGNKIYFNAQGFVAP